MRVATVLPPAQAQVVVVVAPSTATVDAPAQPSSERQRAITSAIGEKMMSTLPPAIGIVPSAVPWIASTETGLASAHGTSALPLAVAMLPETGRSRRRGRTARSPGGRSSSRRANGRSRRRGRDRRVGRLEDGRSGPEMKATSSAPGCLPQVVPLPKASQPSATPSG
jgi:hypothetical protein